jgi:hypothetical protein
MDTLLFPLGVLVATPRALQALPDAKENITTFLARHSTHDWGDVGDEDKKQNDASVENGFRLLSAYKLRNGTDIWVITEADRSATTVLLPEEY